MGGFLSGVTMRAVYVFLALLALATLTQATTDKEALVSKVAQSFAYEGFRRLNPRDPAELSPVQELHLKEMQKNNEEALKLAAEFDAVHVSNADTGAFVALDEEVHAGNKELNLEDMPDVTPITTSAVDEAQAFTERRHAAGHHHFADDSDNDGASEDRFEQVKTDASAKRMGFIMSGAKSIYNKVNKMHSKLLGLNIKPRDQMWEDCTGCRFVWKAVEMDVSNAKYVEDVQASFEHNCLDVQKAEIFYKVCEDMYDDMYAMTDDYMSNDWTVDQMCQKANLCKREKKETMKGVGGHKAF